MITISQVCERYSKTMTQVRYAIQQGRLKAVKIGWQWVFNEEELPQQWPETPRVIKRQKRGERIE